MANESARVPLLASLKDHATPINHRLPPRRRFRRSKSVPLTEYIPPEFDHHRQLSGSEALRDNIHPNLKRVLIFLVLYLAAGTICFYLVRDHIKGMKTNGILDSVYFCIVTMTTVGYGDLVPDSTPSKLLACVFVFSGMALVCLTLSSAADYLVEKQEFLLVRALHINQKVGELDILKEIETNRVRYKCLMVQSFLVVLIVAGTAFLATVEKLDLIDAFYCVCSTITTLGYGDKSFSTAAGRIFAIFWILTSTICLGQLFFCIAEVNTENRQRALVKLVLAKKVTNVDLEAADIDDDGVVGAAEFIIHRLKEMGKICEEDVATIMEQFEDLDVDQSGTLSPSDILLAQSSYTGN
ncbi:two-pore potassium channel 1 [Heracleum sosnowskyi]|uniref:Two-pore potassium channel 1 n=1 Tax=Heracleum sosnowskyi TaxID=360622 RepID=A0AAD8N8I0_9APIA|nr:two-pore potassium channel 1 [Heracleum sosnowskyi]